MGNYIDKTIPTELLKMLEKRGIVGETALSEYLSPKPQLSHDPFLLSGMRAGVDLLLKALSENKKIVIYGDYDVDGITSTALLLHVISQLTDNINYHIPSREKEGYGLNRDAIDAIAEAGGELIVTVDCGSVSRDETEYAHSLGIETIVTDHHNIEDRIAEGVVINPRAPGDEYPFKGLAGVGVAYKFATVLIREAGLPKSLITEVLELVAIGTIADIMPLTDENRTIVKYGLRLINGGGINPGLRKLMRRSGLVPGKIKASDISFKIAPVINSAGRVGEASLGVKLLMETDPVKIEDHCTKLLSLNSTRRNLQKESFDVCLPRAMEELAKGDCLVIDAGNSHEGITGVVAGIIKERLNRPTILLVEKDGIYKGTGRSIETIDLFEMLNRHADMFINFGGHAGACGFTIEKSNVEELRRLLNEDMVAMEEKNGRILDRVHVIDSFITPTRADNDFVSELEIFEPCGKENEAPSFCFANMKIDDWIYLGKGTKWARFKAKNSGGEIRCVFFNNAEDYYSFYSNGMPVDIYGNLELNTWNGFENVQLLVKGILPAGEASRSVCTEERPGSACIN